MIGLNLLVLETDPLNWFLRDADGNVRAALICWGVAIGAFIVLQAPRQVVVACLLAATVTVGFAALVIEAVPVQAVASATRPSAVQANAILPRSAPNRPKSDTRSTSP
jgi:hypothetical protein